MSTPASLPLDTPTDVVVIGAGPAGTATAALLHRAGRSVRIVERQRFPRFVIGESLLPQCMDVLDAAGLLDAVRARGYQEKNGALFLRGATERCDFSFAEMATPGWTWTWQVPRADFDKTLADTVESMGVPIHYAHEVVAASFDGAPRLTVADEQGVRHELSTRFVVDASGYGRVLARLLDLDRPSPLPERMSLFGHISGDRRPESADSNRIWICLHPEGAWIWLIPFSNGLTSVGAVARPAFFERYPADRERALRAILDEVPAAAGRVHEDARFVLGPERLCGYSAAVSRLSGAGYCLVGNATEFLDPVFSSGVTLALESAHRSSGLILRELAGQAVDWPIEYDGYMRRGVEVFRSFVNRWYDGTLPDIFFKSQHDPQTRARICSVLAGYVWDERNPLVRHHERKLAQLARLNQMGALA